MSSRQMKEVEIALEVDAAATSELNLEVSYRYRYIAYSSSTGTGMPANFRLLFLSLLWKFSSRIARNRTGTGTSYILVINLLLQT
jgi:hypothetical protein